MILCNKIVPFFSVIPRVWWKFCQSLKYVDINFTPSLLSKFYLKH